MLFLLLSFSLFAADQSDINEMVEKLDSIILRMESNFTLTKEAQSLIDSIKNRISNSEQHDTKRRLDDLQLALDDIQVILSIIGNKEDPDTRMRKIREKLEAIKREAQ